MVRQAGLKEGYLWRALCWMAESVLKSMTNLTWLCGNYWVKHDDPQKYWSERKEWNYPPPFRKFPNFLFEDIPKCNFSVK